MDCQRMVTWKARDQEADCQGNRGIANDQIAQRAGELNHKHETGPACEGRHGTCSSIEGPELIAVGAGMGAQMPYLPRLSQEL
jgi:hypothetical protein